MTMNMVWDEARKIFIAGEAPDPTKPENQTIDSGPLPPNWHQCFYYERIETPPTAHSMTHYRWDRCRNLAGPGFKPSFCLIHADQESSLHRKPPTIIQPTTAQVVNVTNVGPRPMKHWCKYGPCVEQVEPGVQYCNQHAGIISEPLARKPIDPIDDCGCLGYCEKHLYQDPADAAAELEFFNIEEDVDWEYCKRIGFGQLRYRQNRKGSMMQQQETVHFKLELRGSRDCIDLFHAMLHLCDTDYPLDPFRKATTIPPRCENCGGYIWKNAIITAPDIKRAAKQAGITVKVRTYFPESTCKKKERVAAA